MQESPISALMTCIGYRHGERGCIFPGCARRADERRVCMNKLANGSDSNGHALASPWLAEYAVGVAFSCGKDAEHVKMMKSKSALAFSKALYKSVVAPLAKKVQGVASNLVWRFEKVRDSCQISKSTNPFPLAAYV